MYSPDTDKESRDHYREKSAAAIRSPNSSSTLICSSSSPNTYNHFQQTGYNIQQTANKSSWLEQQRDQACSLNTASTSFPKTNSQTAPPLDEIFNWETPTLEPLVFDFTEACMEDKNLHKEVLPFVQAENKIDSKKSFKKKSVKTTNQGNVNDYQHYSVKEDFSQAETGQGVNELPLKKSKIFPSPLAGNMSIGTSPIPHFSELIPASPISDHTQVFPGALPPLLHGPLSLHNTSIASTRPASNPSNLSGLQSLPTGAQNYPIASYAPLLRQNNAIQNPNIPSYTERHTLHLVTQTPPVFQSKEPYPTQTTNPINAFEGLQSLPAGFQNYPKKFKFIEEQNSAHPSPKTHIPKQSRERYITGKQERQLLDGSIKEQIPPLLNKKVLKATPANRKILGQVRMTNISTGEILELPIWKAEYELGIPSGSIRDFCKNKKTHNGYKFEFL